MRQRYYSSAGGNHSCQNKKKLRNQNSAKFRFVRKILLELHLIVSCVQFMINGTFKSIGNYQNVCKRNRFYRIKICKTVGGNICCDIARKSTLLLFSGRESRSPFCPDNCKYWRIPRQVGAFLLDFMRISRLSDRFIQRFW